LYDSEGAFQARESLGIPFPLWIVFTPKGLNTAAFLKIARACARGPPLQGAAAQRPRIVSRLRRVHMPVFFEGTLKIFIKKQFTTDEGELVEYYEAYFVARDEDGNESVFKINTKKDLKIAEGKSGVVEISMQEGKKPSLVSFKVR